MPVKFNCLLFDFDGTLVNLGNNVNWQAALDQIADLYIKRGVPKHIVSKYSSNPFSLIVNSYDTILGALALPEAVRIWDEALEILEAEEVKGARKATPTKGCMEALQWLKQHELRVGIVSENSERVVSYLLRRFKMDKLVDVVIARSSRYRLKPYPDQILLCLRKIQQSTNTKLIAALVGDDVADVEAGKAAEIYVIVVLAESRVVLKRLLEAQPDCVIENLHELLALFEEKL